jgi:hypothetical protein
MMTGTEELAVLRWLECSPACAPLALAALRISEIAPGGSF